MFPKPGELADEAGKDVWDIGLIGAEPARAEKIAFTAAYAEIEATYLVPAGSPLTPIADVDRPGVRIAVTDRSAYGLWLDRNIKQATLIRSASLDTAFDQFVAEKLDALAGLRPRLLTRRAETAGRGDPARPVHRRAAGCRHRPHQYRGGGLAAGVRRGSQGVRPDRPADRAAQRHRPVGCAAGVMATPGFGQPALNVMARLVRAMTAWEPALRIRSFPSVPQVYSAAFVLRAAHSSTLMRGSSNRSVTREYQPPPCMRPMRSSLGVSM